MPKRAEGIETSPVFFSVRTERRHVRIPFKNFGMSAKEEGPLHFCVVLLNCVCYNSAVRWIILLVTEPNTDSSTLLTANSKSRRLTQLEQSRNSTPPHGRMDR